MRELGFEDGVDTLGRWMSHHLAELIDEAENGSTPAERLRARKSATETILKIWARRASLPDRVYPLAPYKEILKVLELLRPDDNPFKHFGHHPAVKRDQLAASLFDDLSRLIIVLLLMKLPSREKSAEMGAAIKALSKTEQQVLKTLKQWGELFGSTSKSSGRERKSKRDAGTTKLNFYEGALRLIDSITITLAELRSELEGLGRSAPSC